MAIFGALSSGRSGLITEGAALSVIGNNIANVSTDGFKGSRVEFADLITAEGGGQVGKIGLGTAVGAVRTLFEQGSIESTGRSLDVAIEGKGFFTLREGQGLVFTRAGNFQQNADGTITNSLGNILQGTPVDTAGNPTGALQDVTVAGLNSQANPTGTMTLQGNLESTADLKGTPPGTFDGTSFTTAYATSDYATSVQVFDSLGASHQLTMFFTRTGTNAWDVNMGVDDGEISGGTPGQLDIVGTGALNFNTDGTVDTTTSTPLTAAVTFAGASASSVNIDMSQFTQFAGPSGLSSVVQNGFGAGGLVGLTVDAKGVLTATFDNGQTRPLYQLGIASFNNEEGLIPSGNQRYRASIDSGPPAISTAQSQGNGSILGGSLEQSNVQLAQEFISLISTQRAFQANTRVITASDTLLQDLVNVVR
jgi:flagellar hook protein FlgE